MRCSTVLIGIPSLVVLIIAASVTFHGPEWQSRSAKEKLNLVWDAVVENPQSNSWPSTLELINLFIESMNLTFDYVGEDMPKNEYIFWPHNGPFLRHKLIHSVGAIAQVQWVSNKAHNYTGLFQGGDYGLIRFSSAAKPDTSAERGFTPGISLKFFRDGIKSSNFMAMYSLEGQQSFNFFAHDLTNHVPELGPNAPFKLKQLRNSFKAASDWATMLGLSDFASYTQSGQMIQTPNFPFRLVFHPNSAYHYKFPDQPNEDFVPQLTSGLVNGTMVYEIFAQDHPYTDALKQIGFLVLTSPATGSMFGDKTLFFEHVRMENDLSYHPNWVDGAKSITEQQEATDHWTFPDLPWQ